jgi:phage gp29-like protein
MGLEIDIDYAHQVLQIPKAKEGAKILNASSTGTNASPDKPQPANAALVKLLALATAAKGNPSADLISAYSHQLATLCVPHEEALIQQIAHIVAEAGSFEDALTAIDALKINNAAWAESLALGTSAANLAGRINVKH